MLKMDTKHYSYQGLVVGSVVTEENEHSDLVLLLKIDKDSGLDKMKFYAVSKQAFIPPITEFDFLKVDLAKNQERRYAIPLKFGDIIQWNDDDCDHEKRIITSFKRERPLYEVSSCPKGHVLKLGGVIQPTKPTTFWTPIRTLTIPVCEAKRAEPDVWLNAWVKFETFMMTCMDPPHLDLTFVSFEDCDIRDQGRVCEAPWHRSSIESKFNAWTAEPCPVDSDDDIAVEPPEGIIKEEKKWAEVINKQLGLYVGERLIICKELPQYDFIIPLLTPLTLATDEKTVIYPSVGEYFHFSAVWSSNHRCFLVKDLTPYLTLRSHMITPNGNLCARVNHAPQRGLYIDHEGSLGLIDDPTHCLSFFEFNPMNYEWMRAAVEIRAVRATVNRSVRYRIVRTIIDDDYMKRYQEWIQTNTFCVGPINGVLINRDTVVSAKHPNIYFRLRPAPGVRSPPLGAGIRFRAQRELGVFEELLITEWFLAPEFSVRNVMKRGDVCLFQVLLRNDPDHEQLAWNNLVGMVDTRFTTPQKYAGNEYLAWITESPFDGDRRRAATILEVYSTAINPPAISSERTSNLPSSSSSSTHGSQHGSHHGGSHGSRNSRHSSSSFSSNRFIGPKSVTKM